MVEVFKSVYLRANLSGSMGTLWLKCVYRCVRMGYYVRKNGYVVDDVLISGVFMA